MHKNYYRLPTHNFLFELHSEAKNNPSNLSIREGYIHSRWKGSRKRDINHGKTFFAFFSRRTFQHCMKLNFLARFRHFLSLHFDGNIKKFRWSHKIIFLIEEFIAIIIKILSSPLCFSSLHSLHAQINYFYFHPPRFHFLFYRDCFFFLTPTTMKMKKYSHWDILVSATDEKWSKHRARLLLLPIQIRKSWLQNQLLAI